MNTVSREEYLQSIQKCKNYVDAERMHSPNSVFGYPKTEKIYADVSQCLSFLKLHEKEMLPENYQKDYGNPQYPNIYYLYQVAISENESLQNKNKELQSIVDANRMIPIQRILDALEKK